MSIRAYIRMVEGLIHENSSAEAFADVDPAVLDALRQDGFDVATPLYHGSKAVFDTFDRHMARTAADIYTSPDAETAAFYGDHLYLCVGRTTPQADLIDDYALLGRLADTLAPEFKDAVRDDEDLEALKQTIFQRLLKDDPDAFEMDAEDDERYVRAHLAKAHEYVLELLQSGEIYNRHHRSVQDDVMAECFSQGYRSVKFLDMSFTGDALSVVFHDPENVRIVGKIR